VNGDVNVKRKQAARYVGRRRRNRTILFKPLLSSEHAQEIRSCFVKQAPYAKSKDERGVAGWGWPHNWLKGWICKPCSRLRAQESLRQLKLQIQLGLPIPPQSLCLVIAPLFKEAMHPSRLPNLKQGYEASSVSEGLCREPGIALPAGWPDSLVNHG
jgi:hypothetical protein